MILILSQEFEPSTDKVMNWLDYYNQDYFRLNDSDLIYIKKVELKNDYFNFLLEVNGTLIDLKNISCYWYRRGFLNPMYSKKFIENTNNLYHSLNNYMDEEKNKLVETLNLYLKKVPHIGSYLDNNINKLENILIANRCGLDIPDTIITSSKKELMEFVVKHKLVITKPIFESRIIDSEEKRHFGYTSLVDNETMMELPEHFPPTLFQEALEKEFELRIFYLKKKLYSTAIFSQQDEQTKIDFRDYNELKPNRVVPYTIPEKIELKIIQFMEQCDYKTGSMDIVVTDKNFVFLEVNPIGQFTQVSIPGNYHLHKILAEHLINSIN